MAGNKYKHDNSEIKVAESDALYAVQSSQKVTGFVFETEDERLLKDADLPPLQKLMNFTKMIRRNAMLNNFKP